MTDKTLMILGGAALFVWYQERQRQEREAAERRAEQRRRSAGQVTDEQRGVMRDISMIGEGAAMIGGGITGMVMGYGSQDEENERLS